jgi:hypothetical protein
LPQLQKEPEERLYRAYFLLRNFLPCCTITSRDKIFQAEWLSKESVAKGVQPSQKAKRDVAQKKSNPFSRKLRFKT